MPIIPKATPELLSTIQDKYDLVLENPCHFGVYTLCLRKFGIISHDTEIAIDEKCSDRFDHLLRICGSSGAFSQAFLNCVNAELQARGLLPRQLVFRPIPSDRIFQP